MTSEIKFEIFMHPKMEKELMKLPKKFRLRIIDKINLLNYPFSIKFKHLEENYYRVRSGIYRIIYQVYFDDRSVVVIRVALRKNAYKNL